MATRLSAFVIGALFIGLFAVGRVAGAADGWSLTTADLKTSNVRIKTFDGQGGLSVEAADGGSARSVPIDQFVEVSRTLPLLKAAGPYDLYVVGGDHINGAPAGMKGESIVWKHPVVGEVVVPLTRVAGLAKAGTRFIPERRTDDLIVLNNGDRAVGTLTDVAADKITLQSDAGQVPIPVSSVASMTLATSVQPPSKGKTAFRIHLNDGSALLASASRLVGDKLEVTFGATVKPVELSRVSAIEQMNGPVSFLSNRGPNENVYIPYLGNSQRYVARMNADFEGLPIRVRERIFPRAIATHAYSRLTWSLEGDYTVFRTLYAMDDRAGQGNGADVTIRVLLDDKPAFEKKNVRPGALSDPLLIDLGSAKLLTLEVDYGDGIDSNDRLNWLEPALLKVKPPTE